MDGRERHLSADLSYDNVEEVDGAFDVVDPAFVLVYRRVERSSGVDCRFVSCVRVEVTRRFCRRIFGQAMSFIEASVFFWDLDDKEQLRPVTVPSVFVFEDAPSVESAKDIVVENRTLFRHFAPILKGGPTMRLLYERPLFKIRNSTQHPQPPQPRQSEVERRLSGEVEQLTLQDTAARPRSPTRSIQSVDTLAAGSLVAESSGSQVKKSRRPLLGRIGRTRPVPPRAVQTTSQAMRAPVEEPIRTRIPHAPRHHRPEKKFSLDIDPNARVNELKKKIYKARGYLPEQQHLVFNGVALVDNDRLADFDITENSTLMLWLRSEDGTMRRVDL